MGAPSSSRREGAPKEVFGVEREEEKCPPYRRVCRAANISSPLAVVVVAAVVPVALSLLSPLLEGPPLVFFVSVVSDGTRDRCVSPPNRPAPCPSPSFFPPGGACLICCCLLCCFLAVYRQFSMTFSLIINPQSGGASRTNCREASGSLKQSNSVWGGRYKCLLIKSRASFGVLYEQLRFSRHVGE